MAKKLMWLLAAGCVSLSGCGPMIGMFSKTQTFNGSDSVKLDTPRADMLDVVARTGKAIGYSVSGLDRAAGTISLAYHSSMVAGVAYGGLSSKDISITVADGGKTLNISTGVMGNFGNGAQEEADRVMTQFKKELLAELKK